MKRLPLAIPLLAAFVAGTQPVVATAQTFHDISVGLNFVGGGGTSYYSGKPFNPSVDPGVTLQASIGKRLTRRLEARVDVLVDEFQVQQFAGFVGVMCGSAPPPGSCCGLCPKGSSTMASVDVVALGANALFTLHEATNGPGAYVIAGVEGDCLYRHPSAQGATRLGLSTGAGVALPLGGHLRGIIEARYRGLVNSPSQPHWLAPLTLGIRF